MTTRRLIPTGVLAVALLAGGGWLALHRGHPHARPAPPTTDAEGGRQDTDVTLAARTRGSPSAPITVVEIADFQCPACRLFFTETLPALEREYVDAGKVRMIFVNLPLVQLHRNAAAAAEFAMCAAAQHRFWPVHDLLFEQQDAWAPLDDPSPYFYSLADAAKLARDSLDACIGSGRMRTLIMQEAESLTRAGVRSTPSFIINGGLLPGAAPIDMWRPILDSIFRAKTVSR